MSDNYRRILDALTSWHGDERAVIRCKKCGGWIDYYTRNKISCVCKEAKT